MHVDDAPINVKKIYDNTHKNHYFDLSRWFLSLPIETLCLIRIDRLSHGFRSRNEQQTKQRRSLARSSTKIGGGVQQYFAGERRELSSRRTLAIDRHGVEMSTMYDMDMCSMLRISEMSLLSRWVWNRVRSTSETQRIRCLLSMWTESCSNKTHTQRAIT